MEFGRANLGHAIIVLGFLTFMYAMYKASKTCPCQKARQVGGPNAKILTFRRGGGDEAA